MSTPQTFDISNIDTDFGQAAAFDAQIDERTRWLRENAPVYWSEQTGAYIISRYADVVHVSKNNQIFCSGEGVLPGRINAKIGMIDEDEPRHGEMRGLINRGFTPRMVRKWEEVFKRITDEAIDAVAAKGECDFVEDIAVPLPLILIAEMIGIRKEDRERFHQWSDAMISAQGNLDNPEIVAASGKAAMEYMTYVTQIIEDRRHSPKEDLISILVQAKDDGVLIEHAHVDEASEQALQEAGMGRDEAHRAMNNDELIKLSILLMVAGNETTRNGLSGGMQLLIENPDVRKRLIDDPSLIPAAVEEMLRLVSPVLSFQRTATCDTELRGVPIKQGERVLMIYGSANRDAEAFPAPEVFDIDRNPHHLAFGIGNHFCLGANLARMELRVALTELLRRIPDMRYATGGPVFGSSALVRSVQHMDVAFTPERTAEINRDHAEANGLDQTRPRRSEGPGSNAFTRALHAPPAPASQPGPDDRPIARSRLLLGPRASAQASARPEVGRERGSPRPRTTLPCQPNPPRAIRIGRGGVRVLAEDVAAAKTRHHAINRSTIDRSKMRNPAMNASSGFVDSWTNAFLPDREALWDATLAAQGVPIKVRRDPSDSFCDPETMIERMDEIGMQTLVLATCDLPDHAGITDYESFAMRLEETQPIATKYPGRFVAQWSIDPREGAAALDRAREICANPWVVALHTHTHSFDLPFDAAEYYPFYALAHELDLPFVMQAGTSGGRMPSACGHPIGIDRPAIYFPEVDFVLSHTGWPWVDEAVAMALKFSNVFLGTASLPPKRWHASLVDFLRGPGRKKTMYGTSFPTVGHRHAIGQLDALELPDETIADLMGNNARRVFARIADLA